MGRKSTRENKSIYQITRESLGLTREKAGELIPGFSPERIEKIENERVQIRPDDVKLMAEYYRAPGLCNYYCSEECPIGKGRTPRVENRELVQIAVETINGINRLNRVKDRLLEIAEDGTISPDEYEDFAEIRETLEKLQVSVSTLQLWLEQKMAEGEIREEAFE
ncbi:MAG: helix-turn-helix transcriptional regulator [Clostridia bacterium]|nr:helix-turn-helix transcriptional regulator [Clostridia bacterium]